MKYCHGWKLPCNTVPSSEYIQRAQDIEPVHEVVIILFYNLCKMCHCNPEPVCNISQSQPYFLKPSGWVNKSPFQPVEGNPLIGCHIFFFFYQLEIKIGT